VPSNSCGGGTGTGFGKSRLRAAVERDAGYVEVRVGVDHVRDREHLDLVAMQIAGEAGGVEAARRRAVRGNRRRHDEVARGRDVIDPHEESVQPRRAPAGGLGFEIEAERPVRAGLAGWNRDELPGKGPRAAVVAKGEIAREEVAHLRAPRGRDAGPAGVAPGTPFAEVEVVEVLGKITATETGALAALRTGERVGNRERAEQRGKDEWKEQALEHQSS